MYQSSFTVLDGVVLKINDKLKPPQKVRLPYNWSPVDVSQLLAFQYDFAREKKSITLAEEERLIKEQNEAEKLKQQQDVAGNAANAVENNDDENESESDDEVNYENCNNILMPVVAPVSNSSSNASLKPVQPINFHEFESQNENPFELVELQTINEFDELRSVLDSNPLKKQTRKKQMLEQTKTLDDDFQLDASLTKPINKENDIENKLTNIPFSNTDDNNIYINNQNPTFSKGDKNGTLTWTKFDDDSKNTNPFSDHMIIRSNSGNDYMNIFANQPQMITQANNSNMLYLKASEKQSIPVSATNPFLCSLSCNDAYSQQLSKSPPGISSSAMFSTNESKPENDANLTRTKSLPNLNGEDADYEFAGDFFIGKNEIQPEHQGNDYVNVDNIKIPNNNYVNTNRISSSEFDNAIQIHSNNHIEHTNNNFTPTDRINNILKQYKFERFTQYQNSVENTSVNNKTLPNDISVSYTTRQNANPITINANESQISFPNRSTPTSNSNQTYASQINPHPGPMMIHSKPDHQYGLLDNQLSQPITKESPPYPLERSQMYLQPVTPFGPITNSNQELPYPKKNGIISSLPYPNAQPTLSPLKQSQSLPVSTSWLIDETTSLTKSERNFASQLTGMGFSLPCVSRTIKRLGKDQKEVIDFLCMVQQITEEERYDICDVEMAVVNNNSDKTKSIEYLKMVSTFKELGFQPRSIHDALKETSCDQNKALDYLTR